MEILKNIAVILGLIISVGTIICITIPNFRRGIIQWAAHKEKQNEVEKTLAEIKTLLEERRVVEGDLRLEIEKIKESQKSILRDRITAIYYKHLDDKTLRSYELENLTHLYDSYDALDGNSFIGQIYPIMTTEWTVIS